MLDDQVKSERDADFQFAADGIDVVQVRTYNGSLTLRSGPAGEANARARFYARGSDRAEADARLTSMTVQGSVDDGTLTIEVPPHPKLRTNNCGAALDLTLPAGVVVEVYTSNGNVDFEDAFAQPDVRSSNGNVSVRATRGPVKVRTSNGRVVLEGSDDAEQVRVKSSNGGIDFRGGSQDFELVTSNGPVQVTLPGGWDGRGYVHSSNGGVTVRCDGSLRATLRGSTYNGRMILDGPEASGEGELTIETSNGNIRVSHQ